MSRSRLLGTTAAAAILVAGCAPDAASSLEQSVEVHADLTAIFTRELGSEADAVTLRKDIERCGAFLGSRAVLEAASTWTGEPNRAMPEAAMAAGHAYLDDRGTVEGRYADADGYPRFASGDFGFPVAYGYEAWGGATPEGAIVQTFSACLDPATDPFPE